MHIRDDFCSAASDPGVEAANENEVKVKQNPRSDERIAEIGENTKLQSTRIFNHFEKIAQPIPIPRGEDAGPDQVYAADPTFTITQNGQYFTIISNFKNTKRQAEVAAQIETIKQSDKERGIKRIFITPKEYENHYFEGTGDAIYDPYRDVVFAGYTKSDDPKEGRSSIEAHRAIEKCLEEMYGANLKFKSIETRNPYYHIDTVIAPLSRGHMIVNTDGMTPEQLEEFKEENFTKYGLDPDQYMIPISGDDAKAFAMNLRCIGNDILMPKCSANLLRKLENCGYNVTTFNVDEYIIEGGGGLHCLSNNIDEPRIVGGYHLNRHLMPEPISSHAPSRAIA